MRLDKKNGYTECIVDSDCDIQEFIKFTEFLQSHQNISFSEKINDLDSFYWDFRFEESILTAHYNVYTGISIFPHSLQESTNSDNKAVIGISIGLNNYLDAKKVPTGYLGALFNDPPIQWGLRGDRYLWYELKELAKKQTYRIQQKNWNPNWFLFFKN